MPAFIKHTYSTCLNANFAKCMLGFLLQDPYPQGKGLKGIPSKIKGLGWGGWFSAIKYLADFKTRFKWTVQPDAQLVSY
jgi:hypothetical protein